MSNNKKQCTNQPHVKLEFAEELNLPPRLQI